MKNLLVLFSVLFLPNSAWAQMIIDGQVVVLNSGAQLTIQGLNFTNNGELVNEGVISVENHWENNGTYLSNQGSFYLTGTDQIINHGHSVFNQLTILGGGVKTSTTDLRISSLLSMTRGMLEVGENFSVILESGAEILAGQTAYISGTLSRAGSGDLFFPVGTNDNYLPVTLTGVLSAGSGIAVKAVGGNSGLPIDENLNSISNDHFWQLMSDESDFASGIKLPLVDESFVSNTEQLVVAYSNETLPFASLEATVIEGDHLDGSLFSTHNISAGYYAVGKAKQNQSITFEPISEKRETDGSFTLTALASSGLPITYTSSDESVATIEGNVVTIINSGKSQNGSTTITARQEGNKDFRAAVEVSQELIINWVLAVDSRLFGQVNIYPVPFQSVFYITLSDRVTQHHQLIIYDFSGRQVVNRPLSFGSQSHIISDLSQMPEGIYTVQLVSDHHQVTYRILKGRY